MATANRNQHSHNNHKDSPDLILTAPYNFVPLSKKVVRPSWAHLISHDIPFKDSFSGTFQLNIKAELPIFTRNSVSRRITDASDRKEQESHSSKAPDGTYFLPGSSIKGAIRSVLEIMSFGDLAKGLNDEIWGLRDLTLQSYKDLFTWDSKVHCGWLRKEGNDYVIDDCGLPNRISHQQIDEHYQKPIMKQWVGSFEKFPPVDKRQLKYNFAKGTAATKYALFKGRKLEDIFSTSDGEQVKGELVFTGQPSIKFGKDNRGTIDVGSDEGIKYKEFIFGNINSIIKLDGKVVSAFEFAYERLYMKPNDRIPVFFHKNDNGNVASFGLAYMYKIPFTHSVKEAIEHFQKQSGTGPDLAECLFGHVAKNNALKGRVIFGHAIATDNPKPTEPTNEILNSPKASYYPTYIRQKVNNKGKVSEYQTLFNKDAVPSGWKRYPVHKDGVQNNPGPKDKYGKYNEKIQTRFRPLPAGTTFTCSINYHNLTSIELGALLSAITFHQTDGCYHALGMAKPLGYGKCTISVSGLDDKQIQQSLCDFEQYMESELEDAGGWLKSDQIRELLSMSSDQENTGRSQLKYLDDVKKFATAKKEKLSLDIYTRLERVSEKLASTQCVNERSDHKADTSVAENPQLIFEKRKQELIKEIKNRKVERASQEAEEQRATNEQRKLEEQERARKEKEEAERIQGEQRRSFELSSGINLNALKDRKTIESLSRALKYWTETVKGNVDSDEMKRIKDKFSEIYNNLKSSARIKWVEQIRNDLSKLKMYLNEIQMSELNSFIDSIYK